MGSAGFTSSTAELIVNPIKLETGKRTNSAGIPYTLLLRIEAIGFPTFGLLLYSAQKPTTFRCGFSAERMRASARAPWADSLS